MREATVTGADARRLEPVIDHIAAVQRDSGLIPWYADGPADTWDHVEAAMGLSIGGRHEATREAYRWLAETQLDDGSWWVAYGNDDPAEDEDPNGAPGGDKPRKETHRSAYIATGLWHHYRITDDWEFLTELWPTVRDALAFACAYQTDHGEVIWAVDCDGDPDEDALVSANASIYKSLECGVALAEALGHDDAARRWRRARADLGEAIRDRPDRFDRTWDSKSKYAMFWFYPVMCGVYDGERARRRLATVEGRFVEDGMGCRCVSDEPWVTVAETCELILSYAAVGRRHRARRLLESIFQWTDDDGVFWTGYQFEQEELWPKQQPTWTGASVLLAVDAFEGLTPASDLFLTSAIADG